MITAGTREYGILAAMRPPLFVRPFTDAERQALTAGLRSLGAFVLRSCQILLSFLSSTCPRLTPLELEWGHGKHALVDPRWVLSAEEMAARVCASFARTPERHLAVPDAAA
jgi:hypothetical protein